MQSAADVIGAPGLLAGEEEVCGTVRSGEEKTITGRLHSCERRQGRGGHLEGAFGVIRSSKKLSCAMAFLIMRHCDTIVL